MSERALATAKVVVSRLALGGFAGVLTAIALAALTTTLAPPMLIGISVAVGVAVAIVGPKLLELLLSAA